MNNLPKRCILPSDLSELLWAIGGTTFLALLAGAFFIGLTGGI